MRKHFFAPLKLPFLQFDLLIWLSAVDRQLPRPALLKSSQSPAFLCACGLCFSDRSNFIRIFILLSFSLNCCANKS